MKRFKEKMDCLNKERLTEKAFTQSIVVSVCSIILCLIALCSVTWAWFHEGVSSTICNIQSASCDISVSVMNRETSVDTVDEKYTFAANEEYMITLTASGSADSGYCILVIDGTQMYYTEQISTVSPNNVMTFRLKFSKQTTVEILTRWGTSSQTVRTFTNGKYYVNLTETIPETVGTIENNTSAEDASSESNE